MKLSPDINLLVSNNINIDFPIQCRENVFVLPRIRFVFLLFCYLLKFPRVLLLSSPSAQHNTS